MGEVELCRRRWSDRMVVSVQFAGGTTVWTSALPVDADLLRRIVRCGSAAELALVMGDASAGFGPSDKAVGR